MPVPLIHTFHCHAAHNCSPYMFGQAVEVSVGEGGAVQAQKWYTMGREAKELVFVMPDNRTVYITDDGTNVGFFKFVADAAGDLSSGVWPQGF